MDLVPLEKGDTGEMTSVHRMKMKSRIAFVHLEVVLTRNQFSPKLHCELLNPDHGII